MKTYKEAIQRQAKGVVASMFSGGSRYSTPYQVTHTIAHIYEVSPSKVEADIQKLLDSPKFMREAKGGC
jgi:hypothetical protein